MHNVSYDELGQARAANSACYDGRLKQMRVGSEASDVGGQWRVRGKQVVFFSQIWGRCSIMGFINRPC